MSFTHKLAADTLELSIVGTIGDGWSDDPVTAKAVRRALKDAPKASLIKAHINSFGGSYFEGLEIYQLLSEHPARVEIEIGACAASAASLIAMAGDSISMHETSTMLVHDVWTIAIGKASDLRREADDLDLLSKQAAVAYASRTGMNEDDTLALMAEDRFMGADEAKKLGFCTEVRKAKPKGKSNSADPPALTERFVRSQVEQVRADAELRSSAKRVAAAAGTDETTHKPEPTAPEFAHDAGAAPPQKDTKMAAIIATTILAALSLSATATEDDVVNQITKLKADADAGKRLCTTVGAQTADEAVGKIAAFKSASERLADAEGRLADLEKKQAQAERGDLIAKLRAEGKCTPAQEADLFPSMTIESLRAFAKTAVPLFSGDGAHEPTGTTKRQLKNKSDAPKWNDKSYSELTNNERLELGEDDPALFQLMRQHAIDNRLI